VAKIIILLISLAVQEKIEELKIEQKYETVAIVSIK
jgi:hypothetical protein